MKRIIRFFIKNKRITFLQITSLSIGMAAFLILVTYIHQELNYDIITEDAENIYRLVREDQFGADPNMYYLIAEKMKEDFDAVEKTTRVHHYYKPLACVSENAKFNENYTLFVDENFFGLFGFPIISGNPKTCLDNPTSVVISEKAAMKYFGSPDALGEQIVIANRFALTVTGIYRDFPSNSNFESDFIFPLGIAPGLGVDVFPENWDYASEISTFVLLNNKSGLTDFAKNIENYITKYAPHDESKLVLQQLTDIHLNKDIMWEGTPAISKTYVYLLMCVAGVIICVVIVNFLLIYLGSSPRRIYIANINSMFGAGKKTNLLTTFGEIFLVFLISYIAALIFVFGYKERVNGIFPFLPNIHDINLNLLVGNFFVLLILVGIISLYPVFFVTRSRNMISSSSPKNNIPGKQNLFRSLVFTQFVLCIFLVLATSVIFKQTRFLQNFDTGIDKQNIISIPLNQLLGDGIYNENFDVFREELKKCPGVENVTMAFSSPELVQTSAGEADWEGRSEDQFLEVNWNSVFFDYFDLVGLDIVKGRGFSMDYPGDMFDGESSNYILNETAIKKMGLKDPIGKWFSLYGKKGQIVGVVEDYNYASLHKPIQPMAYDMNPFYYNTILVKIHPLDRSVVDDIKKVWNDFLPDYPLQTIFIKDQIDSLYSNEKKLGHYVSLFAVMAIILNCFGLIGMSLLTINAKVKEIGIRKVIGAKTNSILNMINSQFVGWFLAAFLVACPTGWFVLNNWLQNFAYKTSISWWIFVLSGLVTILITLLTITVQSWSVAHKNPVEALRYE